MPDEPPSSAKHQKKRFQKSQLRVAIDTNALYVGPNNIGSASDLVRQEIASLIVDAKYPDLDICWYIPEIVRHERQYQMQTEALKLRSSINKIERLLGHGIQSMYLTELSEDFAEVLGGLIGEEARSLIAAAEAYAAVENDRIVTGDELDVWETRIEQQN